MAEENILTNSQIGPEAEDLSSNDGEKIKEKKKKSTLKFLVYFFVILIATGLALFFSLYKDFDGVIKALGKADWKYLLVIFGLVTFSYAIDGFTIFVFSRLYTRKYRYHQGLTTSLVGAFYSGITPGASGGQITQVLTMKKQGIEPSSAASIMVMSFIVYQICLIGIGIVGLFFSGGLIATIGTFDIVLGNTTLHLPSIPLTIVGFMLNLLVILGLFLMSFSHKFHNFVMHYGIGLLGKIRILKHPDKTRESLRIQVENFKIELRRLVSNIPIFALMIICFSLILIIRFSIPYWAGLALDGYGYKLNLDGSLLIQTIYDSRGGVMGHTPVLTTGQANIGSFWQGVFLSSYHQMATGLIPIPGGAGVSEYFFSTIFANFFKSEQVITAAQILWRFATYHVVILICGFIAAFTRASPKNEVHNANHKTFVTLQYQTYAERKASSDTMFETASLSLKEIQNRLRGKKSKEDEIEDSDEIKINRHERSLHQERKEVTKPIEVEAPKVEEEKKLSRREKRKHAEPKHEFKWDDIEIGED